MSFLLPPSLVTSLNDSSVQLSTSESSADNLRDEGGDYGPTVDGGVGPDYRCTAVRKSSTALTPLLVCS